MSLLVSAYGDGLDADAVLADHPLTRDADPDHVDAWLAMLAGFMVEAREPAGALVLALPAGARRWWAAATWSWLAARRGWR